jgi:hypothetical protein
MGTIKYTTVDNPMTSDPNDRRAVIQDEKSVDLSDLEVEMVAEGTGLTLPQTKAYNEKLFQLIEHHADNGDRINLPVVTIHATITGPFEGQEDVFRSPRNQVRIRVSSGPRLRKLEKNMKVEKVKGGGSPTPSPQEFTDAATGEKNRVATPGGIASLRGYYLKFDPTDPLQGLFYIPVDNPSAAIRVEQFTTIKPSELNFLVPPLPPDTYRLEVRALLNKVKTLRSGSLPEIIEVI